MNGLKVITLFPFPTDAARFEKLYTETHLPLASEKLREAVKITATNVVAAPDYYKIEEVYYPSSQAYEGSLASEAA